MKREVGSGPMQLPAASSSRSGRNEIICSKCQASISDSVAAKFCDQCGHRLRAKQRHITSKNQRVDAGNPSTLSTIISCDGWFWGASELPQLAKCEKNEVRDESEPHRRSPPVHLYTKGHSGRTGGRKPNDLGWPLRRVCSSIQSSFLPALAHGLPRADLRDDLAIPRESPTNPAADVVANDTKAGNSCGVLWGQVLAEAIGEFESKKIILTVEIDSDEGCMCVLAQTLRIEAVARSKYVAATGISPLQSKYNELEKKVRMNKEKLTMVQHRLASLYAQREREEDRTPAEQSERSNLQQEPERAIASTNQDNQCEVSNSRVCEEPVDKRTKKTRKKSVRTAALEIQDKEVKAAAILIQKRFRVLRARRLFAGMVKRAYQRVFDPDTKQYFYYNPRTMQSQWEAPPALVQANATMARQRGRHVQSTRTLNTAASRIQALHRRRTARRAMRALLLQVYEKVYDPDSNSYYYYCSKTKSSSWSKPKLLRDEDEIPTRTSRSAAHRNPTHEAAATKIQTLFRTRATRHFIRDLTTGHIEKHFDVDAQAWYYFNNRTQHTFWEQPHHASLRTDSIP